MFDTYLCTATSSISRHSLICNDCDEILVPQGSIIEIDEESDEEGHIHTLFFIEDYNEIEEEPMHEHILKNRDVYSKWNNKNLQKKQYTSHMPFVNEKSTNEPSLLTHFCKNHEDKQPFFNNYYDYYKSKEHHQVISKTPVYMTQKLRQDIKDISPKLPLVVKDKHAYIDSRISNRKDIVSNSQESAKDNIIAVPVIPKELVMNIKESDKMGLGNICDFMKDVKLTRQTLTNHNQLFKETEDEKHEGKQLKITEDFNNNPTLEKEANTVVINFPKSCDRFLISQQGKNLEALQELIHLATTTISQLKLITQQNIISGNSYISPTILISIPATATVLSNPEGMRINNESESFLDFYFMCHKTCMADTESELAKQVDCHIGNAITQVPAPSSGHEFGDYIGSSVYLNIKSFPDDLISFNDNSLLLGNYAAVDEYWNCSRISLLDAPIEELNQSINLFPSISTLQMLRTSPNTYNSHTGNDIIKATSNVCPNNGKGVTELIGETKATSTKHNSPNNEYHILPATKEPKNEYIPLPQKIPYNIGQPKCFKALNEHLKNDFSSEIKLSTKTAIKHHHLCLKDEKHSTATIKQHPENLDELKKCVYDPKQYLQKCIDISVNKQSDDLVTPKRLTNAKTQIDNRKNNDLKGNSLNNHNQKLDMKIQQLTSIFGDYAFYGSKRSHTNGSVLTDYINIKSNASKLSQKTRKFRKLSNLKCSSQNVVAVSTKASSSKEKSTLFSMRGSENKSSNEIKDGVSKIVISASNNEKNIVNKHKYKKKRNPYGTEEELILVPIVTSALITRREGSSENNRNIKKNSSLLKEREEEIIYWLKSLQSHKRKIDGERQSMSEYKWKKSASFNVRKGHTRQGRRNQTLKCIKNNTQALLQPTVTDFKIPISDTYTSSSNIKPKNHSNNVTSTEFSSVKYDENSHSSENSLCKEIVFYSESSTLENYIGSENLETQKKNLVHKTESQPTKKLNEELSALHTDLSMEPNNTQSQNFHMDEIYCTTKLKDKNNCDILNTSVVDTTPQPQLPTVTPIFSGEIPLNSSVSSKPPPHPKSAKKRNERMNNSILKNKETQLLLISDLMKTNSDTKPLNIGLNCKNSCENKCNFISLAQKSTEHIRSTKSSSSYEHSNSNFFVQTANPTSTVENKNAQLLTEYSSQIAAVDNSATNIQNNESVNTCKKLEGMKTIKDDVRCTWETPGQCLKARNDSQKYRSSLCTGRCSYYDSNIYGRPCSPCRISKAEKCSLKYMESVIGDALNKSHYCRNLSMINSFYKQNQLNTKNVASSMKDPFRMTQSFTVERKIETGNFEMPAKKEQGNKISPLQMLPKHKKKKGMPIPLKSISAKNTTVSSPSAEHYMDSCRRNNGHTMLNRKRVNR
ncbi:hypothetical protein C0J52_17763 [Blattella germanica]|nr:hypothetical protein C0J52_17763 [Blattella germanica]